MVSSWVLAGGVASKPGSETNATKKEVWLKKAFMASMQAYTSVSYLESYKYE